MCTFYTLVKRSALCGYGMSLTEKQERRHAPMSARALKFQPPGGSPVRNAIILAMSLSAALLGGCASPSWNGKVRMWGTLRGVLRDGDTSAKVRLSEATGRYAVGIGAPAGLAGEIVVIDGETWVAQADAQGRAETHHPAPADATATFLAMATVPRWIALRTDGGLSLDGLEQSVRAAAEDNGLDPKAPFPFIVEGRFSTVKLHILNGRCPFAQPRAADYPGHEPIRVQSNTVRGVLVGFYYDGPPGVLTHAGKKLHVHAVLQDEKHTVGHVEAVSVEAGAVIRVPAIR